MRLDGGGVLDSVARPAATQDDPATPSRREEVATLGATEEPRCSSCAGAAAPPSFVYAIGRVEARFPRLSVEKEFAQAVGRAKPSGKSDQQVFHDVLSKRENRYLARQMCWILSIQGLETYLIHPRDPLDFELLIDAIRPTPRPDDLDVVVGLRGPIAPPEHCGGLMVPVVAFDQVYSFTRAELVGSLPGPDHGDRKDFDAAAEDVFARVMQMTDNAGATDEHRALNYLAVRYAALYARAAEQFARDFALTAVDARPAPLGGARRLVDVVFAFTHRQTDFTEKFAVRVDVTEEFPFLVARLSPYFDR
jgi:hypothetical protein